MLAMWWAVGLVAASPPDALDIAAEPVMASDAPPRVPTETPGAVMLAAPLVAEAIETGPAAVRLPPDRHPMLAAAAKVVVPAPPRLASDVVPLLAVKLTLPALLTIGRPRFAPEMPAEAPVATVRFALGL